MEVEAGQPLYLPCSIQSTPHAAIRWERDGNDLPQNTRFVHLLLLKESSVIQISVFKKKLDNKKTDELTSDSVNNNRVFIYITYSIYFIESFLQVHWCYSRLTFDLNIFR